MYSLVGEFIRSVVISSQTWTFDTGFITESLKNQFEFILPVAVVNYSLRNRLKKDGFCKPIADNKWEVIFPKRWSSAHFNEEFERLKNDYADLSTKLVEYARANSTIPDNIVESELRDGFHRFLLGEPVSEELSRISSAFIVEYSSELETVRAINQIREGLVIYAGVLSAQAPHEFGTWPHDLTIVLDTELLLNCSGYNGELFGAIFQDFHNLVKEVNNSNAAKKKRAKIQLRYLSEAREEIERIFNKAHDFLSGRISVGLTTTAFNSIVSECSTPSEVLARKALLFRRFETEQIKELSSVSIYETMPFNIESKELLDTLPDEIRRLRRFSEDDVVERFRQFTIINSLRSGVSTTQLESCGAVLLTGDRLTRHLAKFTDVKINRRDFPFAIDVDTLTSRLWFNLNKGFRDKRSLPKSFDMVTRAQIVLGSQIRAAVAQRYAEIQEKYRTGELQDGDAQSILAEVRSKEFDFERIDQTNLDEVLEFIVDRDVILQVEQLRSIKAAADELPVLTTKLEEKDREIQNVRQSLAELRVNEGLLKRANFQKFKLQNRDLARTLRLISRTLNFLVICFPFFVAGLIYVVIRKLAVEQDSLLQVIGTLTGFAGVIGLVWKFRPFFVLRIRRFVSTIYRNRLNAKRNRSSTPIPVMRR